MADLWTALKALGTGRLELRALVNSIDQLLQGAPDLAEPVLRQLHRGHVTHTITREQYQQVIGHVHSMMRSRAAAEADRAPPTANPVSAIRGSAAPQPGSGSGGHESKQVGIGSVLKDRFQLEAKLGQGGMGIVYKAVDLRSREAQFHNPHVALKVLHEDFLSQDDGSWIALEREASKQQRLAHPKIATVHDFDREGRTFFLTMELIEGVTLKDYIRNEVSRRGGLPLKEALPLIADMADALDYAHQKHIVHSDFKPTNCMLTGKNTVKILDFGIARPVRNPAHRIGEITVWDPRKLGALTPEYASPEMLDGRLTPDPRDDIYALACVSYELLAGHHPFGMTPANEARDSKMIAARPRRLSRAAMRALDRGLAFNRDERSASAREFVRDLERHSDWRRQPLVRGAIAAVILGAVLYNPARHYFDARQVSSLVEAASSHDPEVVEQALRAASQLEPDLRRRFLNDAKNALQAHFERTAMDRADPKAGRYDFAGADRALQEAAALYQDSKRIADAREVLSVRKNELLTDLGERFDTHLTRGELLAVPQADDIRDVLEVLAKVNPQDARLKDPRLVSAHVQFAERALERGDLDRAATLVAAGRAYSSADPRLADLDARIAAAAVALEKRREVDALAARLAAAHPRALDDFMAVKPDLIALAAGDPDNAELARLRPALRKAIDVHLDQIETRQSWQDIEDVAAKYGDLLQSLGFSQDVERIAKAQQAFRGRLEDLYEAVRVAVQDQRLAPPATPNALASLAALRAFAAGDRTVADASALVVDAFINEARAARGRDDWQQARSLLLIARENVGASQSARIGQELTEIDRAEEEHVRQVAAAERQRFVEQRQARVEKLYAEFEQHVAALAPTAESIRQANDLLGRIEAETPRSSMLSGGRETLAARIIALADAEARAGRWDAAIVVARTGATLLPGAPRMQERLQTLQQDREQALVAVKTEEIEVRKQALQALLAAPTLDTEWQASVQRLLQETATRIDADAPWLVQMRGQVTAAYVRRAKEMRDAQRFTEARGLLDAAATYAADPADLADDRHALAVAEQAFQQTQQQTERIAAIEARKQQFVAQVKARQLTKAKGTLGDLRAGLPADDPFLTREAPALFADAYRGLAQDKLGEGQPGTALKFTRAGLEFAPESAELKQVVTRAADALRDQLVRRMSAEKDLEVATTTGLLGDLKAADAAGYAAREEAVHDALVARLAALRATNAELYQALLTQGRQIFPDSRQIEALAGQRGAKDPAPVVLAAITRALEAGNLSTATMLLEAASPEDRRHPEVLATAADLEKRKTAATQLYAQAQTAKTQAEADRLVAQTRDVWTDAQWAKVRAFTPADGAKTRTRPYEYTR